MPLPDRKSPRLPIHDYRKASIYFVTICAHRRRCIFGEVIADAMRSDIATVRLSRLGEIARDEWMHTLEARPYVEHDALAVMPNHVHLLFRLWSEQVDRDAALPDPCLPAPADTMHGVPTTWPCEPAVGCSDLADVPPGAHRFGNHGRASVSSIVGTYKAAVTRVARRSGTWNQRPLWQSRYHDRIVRSEREHGAIYDYIIHNPQRWKDDRYHHEP